MSERRLIIRPGAIGDFVVAMPAIEAMRRTMKLASAGSYLEVWTSSQNVPLARFAEHACSIVSTGLDALDPPSSVISRLRRFDSIVSWYGANRGEFRDWAKRLGLPFQFLRALPPENSPIHAADFYLDETGYGHLKPGVPRLDCARTAVGKDGVKYGGKYGSFAVIHPFSGSPGKNWPLDRYVSLAKKLEPRMPVKWCVGPEESLPWDAVRVESLYELACWLASTRLYVGNDSGITHLAAAAGVPVVALFGATNPVVWGPRGGRVRIVARHSIEEITVDQVRAAIGDLIGN